MSIAGQLKQDQHQSKQELSGKQYADNYNKAQFADNYTEPNPPAKPVDSEPTEDTSNPQDESLRSKVLNRQKAESRMERMKREGKSKIDEKVMAPARKGTNRLLQLAWANLIDSWGLTLIYINLHVFSKAVVGESFFSKLGDEWIPAGIKGEDKLKELNGPIRFTEMLGLLLLDLLALFVIGGILTLIVMIVDFFLGDTWDKFGALWNLGLSGVKALYDLFNP